ncbi:AraC family transcriptional regulator [Bradyrhizobium sp. ERR14]|nr:AraC family transcriptional regulator [Bradyrhizobium sp. ERR14]
MPQIAFHEQFQRVLLPLAQSRLNASASASPAHRAFVKARAGLEQDRTKHHRFRKYAEPSQRIEHAPTRTSTDTDRKLELIRRSHPMTGSTAPMRNPSHQGLPPPPGSQPHDRSSSERRADAEMARVLGTEPLRMALDSSGAGIAHWKHDRLHDVVKPMSHHVIMAHNGMVQRMERRTGKSVAIGTFRRGVVVIIPEGSSSRWDIPKPVDVVQLYLPDATLKRVAREAEITGTNELLERTAHPDPITSRLLLSVADTLGGNEALDTLFRHQLTDLLTTRLLVAHTGSPATLQPTMGGLSPKILLRAIERLRSDSDADVSLDALASDAGLSRFHFCRAFKESTGLSPHSWLRQHRLEQAMKMLRDSDEAVVSIAAALGYSSQTAFAAAFRKLTGETPSDWRRRHAR